MIHSEEAALSESRVFDPIHDTNLVISLIASGRLMMQDAEEDAAQPMFFIQMAGLLRKLCQAWIVNPESVQSILGPTFYQAMKELARDVWRKRTVNI